MSNGKYIAILVDNGFEDIELTEPKRAMNEANIHTTVVGPAASHKYTGKRYGTDIVSDIGIDDARVEDYDAVIIPGGYAPDRMRLHPGFANLIKDMYEKDKVIAAICHGPQLLISAGIVRNKHVTSWPSIKIDLINAGAIWVDKKVVEDGNIITSRKPADIPYFNKAILQALTNRAS
jgi:protease I